MIDATTSRAGFDVPLPVEEEHVAGECYVLAVAVDRYDKNAANGANTFARLYNPVHDANLFLNALLDQYELPAPDALTEVDIEGVNGPVKKCTGLKICTLYNEEATKSAILQHIANVAEHIKPEDSFLVYFAGHGVNIEDDEGYLLAYNAEKDEFGKNGWLTHKELCARFKNKDKCRDLLLVLDCCYAGTLALGNQPNSVKGNFSRYGLTSTGYDQTADDGRKGMGSPFAVALTGLLRDNTKPEMSIKDLEPKLQSRLEMETDQLVRYAALPVLENGEGHLRFRLKVKDKPRVADLKESMIKYLDFEDQRGNLKKFYKANLNQFNLLSTFGQPPHAHKLLGKVLFRWIFEKGQVPKTEAGYFFIDIDLSHVGDEDLWTYIVNQDRELAHRDGDPKGAFVGRILQKLAADQQTGIFAHVIIQMRFNLGAQSFFQRLQDFCAELKTLFLAQYQQLQAHEKEHFGKLFIVLSDERDADPLFSPEVRQVVSTKLGADVNVVLTDPIGKINENHIVDWIDGCTEDIKIQKIQDMTSAYFIPPGQNDTEFMLDEFVLKVCQYLEFNHQEETLLINELYGFNQKSF